MHPHAETAHAQSEQRLASLARPQEQSTAADLAAQQADALPERLQHVIEGLQTG